MPGSHGDFSPLNGENGNSMSLAASIFHHSLLQLHWQTCEFLALVVARSGPLAFAKWGALQRPTDDRRRQKGGEREKEFVAQIFIDAQKK